MTVPAEYRASCPACGADIEVGQPTYWGDAGQVCATHLADDPEACLATSWLERQTALTMYAVTLADRPLGLLAEIGGRYQPRPEPGVWLDWVDGRIEAARACLDYHEERKGP